MIDHPIGSIVAVTATSVHHFGVYATDALGRTFFAHISHHLDGLLLDPIKVGSTFEMQIVRVAKLDDGQLVYVGRVTTS